MNTLLAAPPRARVIGASVPGAAHARRGGACEDAWATADLADGVVIAVADGMGSAPRAAEGAAIAARAATAAVRSFLGAAPDAPMPDAAEHGLRCARLAILATTPVPREMACTLDVVLLTARGAVAAHVGDGAAVAEGDDGLTVLSPPAPSEYVETTDAITGARLGEVLRVSAVLPGARAVAVFTDGLAHAALAPGGGPGARFLAPLLAFAREADDVDAARGALAGLLAGPKVSEHSDDDKTLVIGVLDR